MTIPTTVTFNGLARSDALRAHILEHVQRLERFAGDILSCDVIVELAERSHHQGNAFGVHVHANLQGRELEVSRSGPASVRQEDAYAVVADTFRALRRRIQDYVRRRRGDVKAHSRQ